VRLAKEQKRQDKQKLSQVQTIEGKPLSKKEQAQERKRAIKERKLAEKRQRQAEKEKAKPKQENVITETEKEKEIAQVVPEQNIATSPEQIQGIAASEEKPLSKKEQRLLAMQQRQIEKQKAKEKRQEEKKRQKQKQARRKAKEEKIAKQKALRQEKLERAKKNKEEKLKKKQEEALPKQDVQTYQANPEAPGIASVALQDSAGENPPAAQAQEIQKTTIPEESNPQTQISVQENTVDSATDTGQEPNQ